MSEFKQVTKEEFDDFVNSYPNPLERHLITICDPEMLGYYVDLNRHF